MTCLRAYLLWLQNSVSQTFAPFALSTSLLLPKPDKTKNKVVYPKKGRILFKKSLNTTLPSSMRWMCLTEFTKLSNIGRYFSEVQS